MTVSELIIAIGNLPLDADVVDVREMPFTFIATSNDRTLVLLATADQLRYGSSAVIENLRIPGELP